jgi:ABC-2 type transport system ATP-binding protein
MRQRLQLATALVHDPEVIVLDEPFSGLDPVAVAALSDTLRERTRAGRTLLFSSHQLDLVQDLCEEIVMLDRGRTVLEGSVAELRAAGGGRVLRLLVEGAPPDWCDALAGARVVERAADGLRLGLDAGVDALHVLDVARTAGHVVDFGLELPSLSALFLAAAGHGLDGDGDGDRDVTVDRDGPDAAAAGDARVGGVVSERVS